MRKFLIVIGILMITLSLNACHTQIQNPPIDVTGEATTPPESTIAESEIEAEYHEHNFIKFIKTEAKCEEDGKNIYRCSCGETKEEILPKLSIE